MAAWYELASMRMLAKKDLGQAQGKLKQNTGLQGKFPGGFPATDGFPAMVTVAPPSAGERGGSVRAVIGANGGYSPQLLRNVTLLLRGCGGAAARTANIAHIRPDTVCQSEANGGDCSTDVGRSTPLYSTVQVAQAAAGSLRLALPALEPQDVLSLRIEPGCG